MLAILAPAHAEEQSPRSPITNGVKWNHGKPMVLPGVQRPKVENAFLYRPETAWTFSHHAHLAFFRGTFFAIWSNGRKDEDAPGQRVLLSTSRDFTHWTEPQPLVDSIKDADGAERVLTAAGFYQHQGTLVAYFANEDRHYGDTHLQAVTTTDGTQWSRIREVSLPVSPNLGPQRIASGRLIIAGGVVFPYSDDPTGLAGWKMAGIYPPDTENVADNRGARRDAARLAEWPCRFCEGSFYQTDDGVLHMLLRSSGSGATYRLWLTESRDNGLSWSAPVETRFSNCMSKFHFGRLPDDRFYYVGNPLALGHRTPLVLSLSRDGTRFDRHFILGDEHYKKRQPGRAKGGEYGYPHTLVHNGYLYVICSRQKEAIEVLRVLIKQL